MSRSKFAAFFFFSESQIVKKTELHARIEASLLLLLSLCISLFTTVFRRRASCLEECIHSILTAAFRANASTKRVLSMALFALLLLFFP